MTSFNLRDRARHVFSEARRVYDFKAVCCEAGDEAGEALARLGRLMSESHQSCSKQYDCSHEALDKMVELSMKHGALGARYSLTLGLIDESAQS